MSIDVLLQGVAVGVRRADRTRPTRGRHTLRAAGRPGFADARSTAPSTVLRGIAGFGASAKMHTDRILRLSLDLPIVVEVVETEEKIRDVLPLLDEIIGGGLITLERAHVILYRPDPN